MTDEKNSPEELKMEDEIEKHENTVETNNEETLPLESINEEINASSNEQTDFIDENEFTENTELPANEYTSQFGELSDIDPSMEFQPGMVAVKKKSKALPITIICIAIVLVLGLIGTGIYFIFFSSPSVKGTWKYEAYMDETTGKTITSEEIPDGAVHTLIYYNFTDDKMILERGDKYSHSTQELDCTYTTNEDGTITAEVQYMMYGTAFPITYVCKIEGNIFTGQKVTMSIPDQEGDPIVMERVFSPDFPAIEPLADFEAKDELIGSWTNATYQYTYTFDTDGFITVTSTQSGLATTKAPYKIVSDNKFAVKNSEETDENDEANMIEFTINDGNVLVIGDIEFIKDDGAQNENSEQNDTKEESSEQYDKE